MEPCCHQWSSAQDPLGLSPPEVCTCLLGTCDIVIKAYFCGYKDFAVYYPVYTVGKFSL